MGDWPGVPGGDPAEEEPKKKSIWFEVLGGLSIIVAVLYGFLQALHDFVLENVLNTLIFIVILFAVITIVIVVLQRALFKE